LLVTAKKLASIKNIDKLNDEDIENIITKITYEYNKKTSKK
jgi:hypothetical protein